jgi:hypothetical protein
MLFCMLAHLPHGWSVLYQLARLTRADFENLLQQRVIHPQLTLREARELVAKLCGASGKNLSLKSNLRRRLRQFREYLQRTSSDWQPAERALAVAELTRWVELIRVRASAPRAEELFPAHRAASPLSPLQPEEQYENEFIERMAKSSERGCPQPQLHSA